MRARVVGLPLVLATLALGPGCGCGAVPQPPIASPSTSASAASAAPETPPAGEARALEGPDVQPLLADPRLAEVATAVEAFDPATATTAMQRALSLPMLTDADRTRFRYQLGRLASSAKRSDVALTAFSEAAADATFPLAPYAACAAAQEAVRLGRHEDAKTLAARVPDDVPIAASCRLTLAEAHEARGELAAAIPIWQRHLAQGDKPARWADVSVRTARALLATRGDPESVVAALALARRVALEVPAGALAESARDLEQRAAAALPPDRRALAVRSHADELVRLGALVDGGKATDAEKGATELEAALSDAERRGEIGCKTALVLGKARMKKKARAAAADAYEQAAQRCTGEARITALFQGGSASLAAGRPADALARLEKVEREGKTHRFADDARVKGAQAALALGDEARFSEMLSRIGDDYPEGDLSPDGLFQLALHRIQKGDWAGAVAPLDASIRLRPRDRDYWAAGRAPYFRARALLATGDRARAIDELRRVITEHPLSYYMVLAHARLAELDPVAASAALEAERKRADQARPSMPDHPSFHTPAFARVLELLRQGEPDLARAEIAGLGLNEKTAPPDVLWTIASLYGSAGAVVQAHAIPRGRVTDWLDHYPVGSWARAWQIAYPRPWPAVVAREAKRSQIPVSLAYAIMREESAFDPAVVSGSQAIGLMQLIVPTAKTMGKKLGMAVSESALKTPPVNVALGCRYLADLRAQWSSMPVLAIPSYNAGPGAPRRWLAERPYEDFDVFVERIPYEETRNYTKRVMKSYAAYLFLYEPELLSEVLRLPMRAQPSLSPAQPQPQPEAEPEARAPEAEP